MITKKNMFLMGLIAIYSHFSFGAAVQCPNATEHDRNVGNFWDEVKDRVSANVDVENEISDNHKFLWINTDMAGCDLGFSMPGLPNLGIGLDGIDGCQVLRAVTGDAVREANASMQDAVDAGVQEVTGGRTDFNIDLGEIAIDEIESSQ